MKTHRRAVSNRGFTLVELMVGITVGLMALLIIIEVFAISNIRNRQIAGGNDAQQAATIVSYQIGNILRQAGSNLLRDSNVWGCELQASKGADTLVPFSGSSWPVPFSALARNLRVTPVTVLGAEIGSTSRASDVVVAMGGTGGTSNIFLAVPKTEDDEFDVENSNGVLSSDYLLMADSTAIGSECYLFRVSSAFMPTSTGGKLDDTPKAIPLDREFMVPDSLKPLAGGTSLFNLGIAPKFYLLGVDSTQKTLTLYDLLQNRNAGTVGTAITLGENVFLLRVLYGVDSGSGKLIWHSPLESGWTFNELQSGTLVAKNSLGVIKALRIALVMRATYPAGELSPESITLFSSLADDLQQTVALTDAERRYRYQVYETVVPLFNI